MPTRVQLDTIVEDMEMQLDEMNSFLHRPSGRVVAVSHEALQAAENDDDLGVSEAELADARRIISAEDEYLALPGRFEIDGRSVRRVEGAYRRVHDYQAKFKEEAIECVKRAPNASATGEGICEIRKLMDIEDVSDMLGDGSRRTKKSRR